MKLRELRHNRWNIGFVEGDINKVLSIKSSEIHWASKKITDRWFADPFIFDYNDNEIIVLAEEFQYGIKKGRIARVTFDRTTYEELDYDIIFERSTHMSFPFILRLGSDVYIIPENSASGQSSIYKYDDKSRSVEFVSEIIHEPLTDATVFDINGNSYLLSTKLPDPNGNKLSIYNFCKETLKVTNKIFQYSFESKIARNAGEGFVIDGVYYRPAQDCNLRYGHGVLIQRINFANDSISFESVNKIYPSDFKYNLGIHTFNHYKELMVFDCNGYRYPICGRILTKLFKLASFR